MDLCQAESVTRIPSVVRVHGFGVECKGLNR